MAAVGVCSGAFEVRGQGDTLRDRRGRVVAYSDGYGVYGSGGEVLSESTGRGLGEWGVERRMQLVSGEGGQVFGIESERVGGAWAAKRVTALEASGRVTAQTLPVAAAAREWGVLVGQDRLWVRRGQDLIEQRWGEGKRVGEAIRRTKVLPKAEAGDALQLSADGAELLLLRSGGQVLAQPVDGLRRGGWKPTTRDVWERARGELSSAFALPIPALSAGPSSLTSFSSSASSSAAPAGLIGASSSEALTGASSWASTPSSSKRYRGSDQGRTSVWHFGERAGLRFGPEGVVAISGHRLRQLEGSSSLSLPSGEVVAYSDGVSVYDGRDSLIVGGKDLESDASATQGALLVPVPNREDQLILFTVDQGGYRGPSRGLRASRIDLTGGLRAARIEQSARSKVLEVSVTEKLAGVHHRDGQSVWVLSHRSHSKEFVAYRVTPEGLVAGPVVSSVGSVHSGLGNGTIGQLKFCSKGRRVAAAIAGADRVEVFDFDPATGRVLRRVLALVGGDSTGVVQPYGVEFSQSGRYLFVTSMRRHGVARVDLEAGDSLSVVRSVQWQGGAEGLVTGSLQLGPDGDVYVALSDGPAGRGSEWLGRVTQAEGRWRYQAKGVKLVEGSRSRYGLPAVVASLLGPPRVRFELGNACAGEEVALRNTSSPQDAFTRWQWRVDGEVVSSQASARYRFGPRGSYRVTLVGTRADGVRDSVSERVQIEVAPSVSLGPDRALPEDGTALELGPEKADSAAAYHWSTGASKAQIEVHSPGEYVLTGVRGGCVRRDTIRVLPRPTLIGLATESQPSMQSSVEAAGSMSDSPASAPPPPLGARLFESSSLGRLLRPFEPIVGLSMWVDAGRPVSSPLLLGESRLPTQLDVGAFTARPILTLGLRYFLHP